MKADVPNLWRFMDAEGSARHQFRLQQIGIWEQLLYISQAWMYADYNSET